MIRWNFWHKRSADELICLSKTSIAWFPSNATQATQGLGVQFLTKWCKEKTQRMQRSRNKRKDGSSAFSCVQGSYRSGKTGKKSVNLSGQGKVGRKYFLGGKVKAMKNWCHQMSDFHAKMHQIWFALGLRPRPRWGSLQHFPRPPSCT